MRTLLVLLSLVVAFVLVNTALWHEAVDQQVVSDGAEQPQVRAQEAQEVYVPGSFSLRVMQQPVGDPLFVPDEHGVVSQFSVAAAHGTVGLLAHNTLDGAVFFYLNVGSDVYVAFDGGAKVRYVVSRIERYQALSPLDPKSSFINLDSGETLTYEQVFNRVYAQPNQLTLQTCIEAEGDPSWGRLFVIAEMAQ
jgi:hypothetical protein